MCNRNTIIGSVFFSKIFTELFILASGGGHANGMELHQSVAENALMASIRRLQPKVRKIPHFRILETHAYPEAKSYAVATYGLVRINAYLEPFGDFRF